jgi:hypothetical protein
MGKSLLNTSRDTTSTPSAAPSINAPKIESTRTLRATVRAISDVDQVYRLCESMFDPNSDRNRKNGILADLLNAAPPYGPKEHKEKGQGYRHNFSTGFLPGVVDPVVTAPVDIIDNAQFLTSASLSVEDDPTGSMTDAYRRKFTKLVKSWDGWRDHIYQIFGEDVPYGYAAVVCDDPDDWRPEVCRQDEFAVPDNTGQTGSKCQFFGRKKSFYIHELIETILKQPEEGGPWNLDACVEALNEAMPEDRSEQGNTQSASSRTFVDLVRDGNAGAAYDPRARTVQVYILYATEADGKVSKYIVQQKQQGATSAKNRLLYESEDEFEKMSDVIMFYALKPAKTLFSSKGMARDLGNIAMATERGRNKAADHVYLGSLVWMVSEKGMVAVSLKVMDTCAVVGSEAKVMPEALPDRSDAFDRLDERMTRYGQQVGGQYILSKPSQEGPNKDRTAHEVERDWQQQMKQQMAWLKRAFGQFGDMMTMIAGKAGSPGTGDEEAKEWQEDLEENDGITPELLKKLVNQPQGQLIDDMTQSRTNAMVQALPMVQASPNWDHVGYEKEVATRMLGKETVDKYFKENATDPNDEIENTNQQLDENDAMRNGGSRAVSGRHNHRVHLKWLVTALNSAEPKIDQKVKSGEILQTPEILDNHQTAIKHGDAHVAEWQKQAEATKNGAEMKESEQFKGRLEQSQQKLDGWLKAAVEMKKKMQEQQQADQQQQPPQPQQNGQAPKGQMAPDLLKEYVKHLPDLPIDIQIQIETLSGLNPSKEPAARKNGSEKPLTPQRQGVTQEANP